jgi:putative nucleotidyltransferase with HDIG domain
VNETLPRQANRLDAGQHDIFPSGQAFAAWLSAGLGGALCLFLALSWVHVFSPGLKVSDIADRDLVASAPLEIIDKPATDSARETARQSIIPVFQVDKSRDRASLDNVSRALKRIEHYQTLGLVPLLPLLKTRQRNLRAQVAAAGDKLTAAQILDILVSPDGVFAAQAAEHPALQEELQKRREIVQNIQKNGERNDSELLAALTVQPDDLADYARTLQTSARRLTTKFNRFPVSDRLAWEEISTEFLPDQMSPPLKRLSSSILAQNLEPNLVIDHVSTQAKADTAVKTVAPIMRKIEADEVIVPRGSMITREKLELLQALDITHVNRWPFVLSIGISLIAALTLVALFLLNYEAKHFFSSTAIGLMFTVAIVAVLVASIIGKSYPQFVPLPAAALILTIFFGRRVAIIWTLPMIMLVAVDRLIDFHHVLPQLLASTAAIYTYSRQRNALITTGLFVAAGQVFGDLSACAFNQSINSWAMLGRQASIDFLGGMSSAILAIGSLPFLENIFGLITPYRLAELTDANQPLLRRLEENAPGTYQHSLAVANLAEAGAKAISADPNLVRAGALYHDIGKMVRPKYFIENQLGATNPHDAMKPEESRNRVLAHVTDGIALAEKYALPKAVQDFIPMHQGTTLMAYFYHKACVRDGVEQVDASFYRYPGPKPNTKETAVVMLADVSEAVTHSMQNPTNEEVEIALDKVFQNRWDDGQFTDSGLTFDELQKVRAGFCRVWRTLHHERLKYPATTTGKMPIAPESKTIEGSTAIAASADTAEAAKADTAVAEKTDIPAYNDDCCSQDMQ